MREFLAIVVAPSLLTIGVIIALVYGTTLLCQKHGRFYVVSAADSFYATRYLPWSGTHSEFTKENGEEVDVYGAATVTEIKGVE